jgi:hypothetical protein
MQTDPFATDAPMVTSGIYLVDFGATPDSGRRTWLSQFQIMISEVGRREWKLPVPVEDVAVGRSGRTVLRIWAPDPDHAVKIAQDMLDDGPQVNPL